MTEQLHLEPAISRTDLVCNLTIQALHKLSHPQWLDDIMVAEIAPEFAGGHEFCARYGVSEHDGANCVIVEGRRGNTRNYAACLIPVCARRTDFNGIVRRILNARQVSLARLEDVLQDTGMEYGSITALGLPEKYRILIDSNVADREKIIIGSGLKKSKLFLPTKVLTSLPLAEIVNGLAS